MTNDPRFKTVRYGERGRDWDLQIALTGKGTELNMLTDDERALIEKLGECVNAFGALLSDDLGPLHTGTAEGRVARAQLKQIHEGDVAEFVAHVHDLQHAVMARAARRAHPDVFGARLL